MAADLIRIIGKLQSLGFCLDVGVLSKGPGDVSIEELRPTFDHILSLFLTEIHLERGHKPIPVMIGGNAVDLFKLYLLVRGNGGYESVSDWAAVAEEIGLDSAAATALKLVYVKYLDDMDRWLRKALDEVTAIQEGLLVDELKNEVDGDVRGTTHGGRSAQKLDFDDVDDAAYGALVQEAPKNSAYFPGTGNLSSEKTTRSLISQTVNKQDDYHIEKNRIADAESHLGRLLGNKSKTKYCLGPAYQATMPEWTVKPSTKSDYGNSKWLGARIWPPESQVNATAYEHQPIGKGRQDTCQCNLPGSVECVRFHVAEKRFQLNRELGPAFHSWRFIHMGEEVALSWTEDEQRAFKGIVHRYPPSKKHYDGKKIITLWGELYKEFWRRGIKNIVRYYFNVFVLARRSYQNRMTPKQIDSDDDKSEYKFLCRPYGYEAVRN